MNKTNGKFAWQFLAALAALLTCAASVAAQTVVVGTGNPDVDVPAVQAAVDQGGEVILRGHFSFDRPPTVPTATAFVGGFATVLVSRAVVISGTQDGDRERATIEGGTTPFYVEAPGASVTIQGLRFIRPEGGRDFCVCGQRTGDRCLQDRGRGATARDWRRWNRYRYEQRCSHANEPGKTRQYFRDPLDRQ